MNPIVRAWWNRWLGDRGERAAARHLRRQGMRILVRGYRTPQGEIDLIARDGQVLVFVEVKARRQGAPAEAVTPEKQRRLTLAALHFLKRHGLLEQRSRFDVVAIVWPEGRTAPTIEHIRDAFEAVGRWQMFR
jgi:putative endonuclease